MSGESELPRGWISTTISQVAYINPKSKLDDTFEVGFVPMAFVPKNFTSDVKFEKRKWGDVKKGFTHFKNDDVIFAKITPCFENSKAAIISDMPNGHGAGSTEYYVVRLISIPSQFLFYFIKTQEFLKIGKSLMTGSVGQKRVPKSYIQNHKLPLPPLPEQHRIVKKIEELFTNLDAGVRELNRTKQLLKQYRQSLLKHAFEGRLTADWRTANRGKIESASVLLARIREERKQKLGAKYKEPEPIDVDKLPNLPEGWAWVRWADAPFDIIDGDRGKDYPKKNEFSKSGYCLFLNTKNVLVNGFNFEQRMFISKEHDLRMRKGRLNFNDVVLTTRGTIGNVGIYEKSDSFNSIRINSGMLILRPDTKIIKPKFLFLFIQSPLFNNYKQRIASGSAQPQLPIRSLSEFPLPLPSLSEQEKICSMLDTKLSNINHIQEDLCISQTKNVLLRNSILKSAFAGKLVPQDPNDEPASHLLTRIKETTK